MRNAKQVIYLVFIMVFPLSSAQAFDSVKLTVNIESDSLPQEVVLSFKDTGEQKKLDKSSSSDAYSGILPINTINKNSLSTIPMIPCRVIGDWGDYKEYLFLGIKPGAPENIPLKIHHYEYSESDAGYEELSKIDALGSDFSSVLEKYFRARAFHYVWRNKLKLPEHMNALRSARLWYDSAFKLVKMNSRIFRSDEDVIEIVNEYEKRKKIDPKLRERWEKYAEPGYIANMNLQLAAMNYQFVGEIPVLVGQGKWEKASRLNNMALRALENEQKDIVSAVVKYQGVSKAMLKKNDRYFSSAMR